jgi:acyl-CoA synthetase (AMP-forming)/AMP-acid ligase II
MPRRPVADSDTIASVGYTSGSTGLPKGVRLPHRNLLANAELNVRYFDIEPDDRACLVLPLFFGMNKSSLLAHLLTGACVLLERGFLDVSAVVERMQREQVTSFSAVPTLFQTLLARGNLAANPLTGLRRLRIGAGIANADLIDRLQSTFPAARIYLSYGLAEVGLVTVLGPADIRKGPGCCGSVLPELNVKVIPNSQVQSEPTADRPALGEIVVNCGHVAAGYEHDADETNRVFQPDGVHTGDLGWIDENAYLYLTGRAKELIKSAGENIHPGEVEGYLNSHPKVADCVVIGVSHPWLGEAIEAFVVARSGAALEAQELLAFCRHGLSPLRRPQAIHILEQFPRTATGKVDKKALLKPR